VETKQNFRAGAPRLLFAGSYTLGYDVGADGRFLMVTRTLLSSAEPQINVVLNWSEELRRVLHK
jgi:hypothetical protein